MFVGTQTNPKATAGLSPRHIEYLLASSLAFVTIVLFFVMGFFSTVSAAPTEPKHENAQVLRMEPANHDLRAKALPTIELTSLQSDGQFYTHKAKTSADRYILTGMLLLVVAFMASFTFGLWRWQLNGLATEAKYREQ